MRLNRFQAMWDFRLWLLWPKFLYFMLNFCVYASYHFSFKYLRKVYGISDSVFGLLNSLTGISFLSSIFWTNLADVSHRHTLILAVASAAYALSFSCLWFAQDWISDSSQSIKTLFVAICYLLTNIFISALYPILDSKVMILLSESANQEYFSKDLFGRQRLWGCVGQSAVGLVSGFTIDKFGFNAMFLILLGSTLIFIIAIVIFQMTQLDSSHNHALISVPRKDDTEPLSDQPAASPFYDLVSHPRFILLLFLVLIGGVTRGIVGNYLQQFLERYYHQTELFGFASLTLTRLLTEIISFFIGKPLLKMFGAESLLVLGIAAGLLRVGSYGFMPIKPEWKSAVPFIELLKGINSAFIVVAGTRIAHDIAPKGAEAIAQGFFSGIHGNLSNSLSGLFGSVVLYILQNDYLAIRHLFQISAYLSLVASIIYTMYISFFKIK